MLQTIPTGRRRILASLGVTVLCLYAPFSWILLIDYPWNSYRLLWLKLWPILPGFVPGFLLFHHQDFAEFSVMGVITVLLIAVLTYVGTRGRLGLVGAAFLGILVSVPSAMMSYVIFRA